MTPRDLPPPAICKICEMPIPEAKPTRNRNIVCLACMANGGVDLIDHCPVCERKRRLCECEPPPQERR